MIVRSAQWNAEESSLLARQEARLTLEGARFLNQALGPYFPNRTLEAIIGQRRYQKHKDLVSQYIRELEAEAEAGPQPVPTQEPTDDHQSGNIETLRKAIMEELAEHDPLTSPEFKMDMLSQICQNVSTWPLDRIAEQLELYLLEVFPIPVKRKRPNPAAKEECALLTKRQARRGEYARTQRAWKKNSCNCLRVHLKDKTTSITPEKGAMVPFWRTIMTKTSDQTPGVNPIPQPQSIKELWRPIKPIEVKKAFPELTTSPGSDGITACQLRAVPMKVHIGITNLLLLCGRLPKQLLKSKTTLMPKKDGASEPGDLRPITVSSVLTRLYHKILANQLARFINLDKRQKAFLPVDGTAGNIFDLDTILRYHRQN